MTFPATNQARNTDDIVAVALNGGRVTFGFRAALFEAAGRVGVSVNEFVLQAAADKLIASGHDFPGVFHAGDLSRMAA